MFGEINQINFKDGHVIALARAPDGHVIALARAPDEHVIAHAAP